MLKLNIEYARVSGASNLQLGMSCPECVMWLSLATLIM